MSAAALLPLLQSDKLCVDEAELVRAARSWARVGAVSGDGRSARALMAALAAGTWSAGGGQVPRAQGWCSQAVLERPVAEVAAPVVRELRLALLAPAELSALEEQNRGEPLIPVRTRGTGVRCWQRGGGELEGVIWLRVFGKTGAARNAVTPSLLGGANCGGVEVPRPA